MEVLLNGRRYEVPDGSTLRALLDRAGLARDGVAVAVNMQVVPRGEHERTTLAPGDRVEVIMAVGGG